MAAITSEQVEWRRDIIPSNTKRALDFLAKEKWLSRGGWYLAGGTALALQAGNRQSVDLDFFSTQAKINTRNIIAKLSKENSWRVAFEEENTLYAELFQAKVSFIAYPFFVPKSPPLKYGTIKVLPPTDIAVMKIIAISQRGRKRDFFDLYWCAHHLEPLERTIKQLPNQYPAVAYDYHHILKSLVYFADAESDPEPTIYFKASWRQVKGFFEKEVPRLMQRLILRD